MLVGVLRNQAAAVSAHDALRQAEHAAQSLTTLCHEYQTIATTARTAHWDRVLASAGLDPQQQEQLPAGQSRRDLHAALEAADARGIDVATKLAEAQLAAGDDDFTTDLAHQIAQWSEGDSSPKRTRVICGLVTAATHPASPDVKQALDEREAAIRSRVTELAHDALRATPPWTRALGPIPVEAGGRQRWMQTLSAVAGYRERWGITDPRQPVGPENVGSTEQRRQRQRAQRAIDRTTTRTPPHPVPRVLWPSPVPEPVPEVDHGVSI